MKEGDGGDAVRDRLKEMLLGGTESPRFDYRDQIPRRDTNGPAPASHAQRRLWFVDRLEHGESARYNVCDAIQLDGPLDLGAFQAALESVVARHEVLRTSFALDADDDPVQVVHPHRPVSLPLTDVSGAEDPEGEARQFIGAEHDTPIDISSGSVSRYRMIRLAPRCHVFVHTTHHIAFDGWSNEVFVGEVCQAYAAALAGRPAELPALQIQYADFAAWQRSAEQEVRLAEALPYWRSKLDGLKVLDLPRDRPTAPVREAAGAELRFHLTPEVTARLQDQATSQRATLFMTLLAGYSVLLAKYTGDRAPCVGSPLACRDRADIEPLIGFFVNMLPMRTDLSGDPTLEEVLRRVRVTCLEAYDHSEVPFEMLVSELVPDRELSHDPIIQTTFLFQEKDDVSTWKLPGIKAKQFDMPGRRSNFDLALEFVHGEDALAGNLRYRTQAFDESTVRRLQVHLVRVLEAIASEPHRRLSEIELVTLDDYPDALKQVSQPAGRDDLCLHELFEQQAQQTPDRVALTAEGASLTYAQVERRANRLGAYLRECGVVPDELVGISMPRTSELVITMLALFKVGAAYVPIDPRYPKSRIRSIVEDAGVEHVITHGSVPPGLEATGVIDTQDVDLAAYSGEAPTADRDPGSLAYVIYTSGSTGRPNGVMVDHRNVVRLFQVTQPSFAFGPDDVWTLFHSYAFDFSVWEIWGALLHGGRLVIVPEDTARKPRDFGDLVRREGVTILNQTPSAFQTFVAAEQGRSDRCTSIRHVIFGGEALEPTMLGPFVERQERLVPRLTNMYGITETTVHVTHHDLDPRALEAAGGSPIGTPLSDLCVYVLDDDGNLVPPGVPGEMHVGGAGVSRGYLGRPELTRERFIEDRFSGIPGGRLYRTGDLAVWRQDGTLLYRGRKDFQVQVRGHRVEPGEVEHSLRSHPAVGQCAVVPHEREGHTQLVGYVVVDDASIEGSEIHRHIAKRLPQYMVPSRIVMLDGLPLTSNGKLDRDALPLPGTESIMVPTAEAPKTPVERVLAEVWAEVLGLPGETIARAANFFDVGGDSLLAIKLINRAQQRFPVSLDIQAIFQHSTLAEFAAYVDQRLAACVEQMTADEAEGMMDRLQEEGLLG